MQDHLVRATGEGIRVFAAVTTNLVDEARRRHACFPVASAALGRTMTAALLFAANLKTDECVTIRIVGNGPLRETIADAHSSGTVRGYVKNPHIDLPLHGKKLDVGRAVGSGLIYVTRFTGLKQPFTGSAPLVSGEIAEDVANYLLVSEQTSSSIGLGVLVEPDMSVSAAGGFIIQALPGADDEVLATVERNLSSMEPVSQIIRQKATAKDMIEILLAGLPINLYEQTPLSFKCACSRKKVTNMLVSLGHEELRAMAEEGKAEICCHFCGEKYHYTRKELQELLDHLN